MKSHPPPPPLRQNPAKGSAGLFLMIPVAVRAEDGEAAQGSVGPGEPVAPCCDLQGQHSRRTCAGEDARRLTVT